MLNVFKRATFIGRTRYLLFDRYYNRVIPVFMVAICISATLLSAVLWKDVDLGGSVVPGLIPVLVIAGLGFVALVYTHMEQFSLIILMCTTLLSDGISTGTGTKITFTLTLLCLYTGLWLFKMIIVDRKIRVLPSTTNIPGLMFIIAATISFFWSSAYTEYHVLFLLEDKLAVRIMTLVVIIVSVITHWLYANNIRSIQTLRFFTWWFIIIGAIFMTPRILTDTVPQPFNAGGQFSTWVGIMSLGQMLFNHDLKKWMRLALLGNLIGWSYISLSLGITWLSGWMPLVLGVAILLFLYSRRMFIIFIIVVSTAFFANETFVQKTFEAEKNESGDSRQEAWQRVLDVTARHPIFGTGPAGYYFYFTVNIGGFFQLSHNNYLDIIGQTGLLGITIWLIFWGAAGIMTWRMYRIIPHNKGFQRGLANTLLASYACTILSMMLGDWITPFPYTQSLAGVDYTIWAWMLLGITIAFYYIAKREQQAEAAANRELVVQSS
jgi:O-antigen ligase